MEPTAFKLDSANCLDEAVPGYVIMGASSEKRQRFIRCLSLSFRTKIKILPPLDSSNGVNTPYHHVAFRDYGQFPMNLCSTSIATLGPMETAVTSRKNQLLKVKSHRTDSAVDQITVLLAEDHPAYRSSLKVLMEADGDIEVVGEAKNGCEAVRLNNRLHPDVIVMDIAMPLLNGLQATRQIMETSPATKVLILSAHPDSEYIEQAMVFGAAGYLLKQSSSDVLAQAIREVQKGKAYFSMAISKQLRDQCQKTFSKGHAKSFGPSSAS